MKGARHATRSPKALRRAIVSIVAVLCALAVVAQSDRPAPGAIVLRQVPGVAGTIGIEGLDAAKAGRDLLAIHDEYQRHLRRAHAQAFESSNSLARIVAGDVVIEAVATGEARALAAELEGLGLRDTAVSEWMVSGRLAISAIPALQGVPSLKFVRPAYSMTQAGEVTSQGDVAMRADIARGNFGVDGTGVTVGVLSDSFDCLGGAADGVASGDLPAGIEVLQEGPCPATDEARAMAEIIHDVAPGAAIAVHSAVNGQASFAQGIIDLANAGAQVITDDVIYLAEPMFQDGIVAQAVDRVKALGVGYFSAAGNQARQSYDSPFRPSGQFFDIGRGPAEAHDFDPDRGVDTCQQITIPVGRRLILDLQWDQPFASVSGPPGSQSDLDIVLTDEACTALVAGVATGNLQRDPVEVFGFSNEGPATTFGVIVVRSSGPDPASMKTVLFGSGRSSPITIDEFDTGSASSFGHQNTRGGLGIGAAFYRETPAFGTTPPRIEDFSSAGGVPILFDTQGNRLSSPEFRAQPGITAPDGANTTFFGGGDTEGDSFPNFFGTSASAPHAAGVAALMKDLVPTLTPDQIYGALMGTAIDMDDPSTAGFDSGFDSGTGHGLIEAVNALRSIAPRPDLALTKTDSPDPVTVGNDLSYAITVTNSGPSAAAGVTVTDPLAAGVSLVSATPSQGSCNGTRTVICTLGGLADGANATVTIVVTPTAAGVLSNTASAEGSSIDPDPGNDSATESTTVIPAPSAEPLSPRLACRRTTCDVRLTCTPAVATLCVTDIDLFVTAAAVRSSAGTAVKARKPIRIAAGVSNIRAGGRAIVKLTLTRRGKQIVKTSKTKTLPGTMVIRNSAGSLIARIRVKIRLR